MSGVEVRRRPVVYEVRSFGEHVAVVDVIDGMVEVTVDMDLGLAEARALAEAIVQACDEFERGLS